MLQYWYISWLLIFFYIFFVFVYFLFFFFFFLFGDSYQYIGVYIHFVCINICILLIKNNISKIKKKDKKRQRKVLDILTCNQTEFYNFCNPVEKVQITVYIPGVW